ncbi:MAG: TolC family outer membrane protein [Castellaniella sp.]|uniref:TolC family outer membrane protein n=1 Tax=Castellaniella sp. TaxID=1955812 RepID=UPI002A35AD60|nr:TolC family outer membrane protein [Castellaniella sp.]MDY0309853.1 TolC family outer membrane protein [Castellaniella sp.]
MVCHKKAPLSALGAALVFAFSPLAFADNVTLPQAVETAVLHNPEVQAQFHNFQSGLEGQKVRRGALLPEVNLQGWTGREYRGSSRGNGSTDWSRSGYSLSLRQLLFDGFSTINDVRQLGFEKLADYYTLKATVDDLAQQATQAYLDVQRYREQVALAQQNYNLHKDILSQISERSSSGVGRGVDEVQAQARLALAQTNLLTASGNLNDVTQRYQRIIGQVPAETLSETPDVDASLPKDPTDFSQSVRVSPTVLAKQALVQAAERGKASAQGRFAPTLELRAATGRDRSDPPYISDETTRSSNVQLMATFNLFRGGADAARVRQTAAQTYAARDVRDYTCRNVQQELSVAWNNIVRLRQQMPFLQQHERDIARVRVAYMQQFKIGQRTLLDLLDTENELFDARRALANGIFDLRTAEYRWLALSHKLLPTLGLADPYQEQPDEASKLEFPDEVLKACLTPLPDTRNLQPLQVNYQSGMKPPVLAPADKAASGWN